MSTGNESSSGSSEPIWVLPDPNMVVATPFAVPVPRTCHMISNVYVEKHDDHTIMLRSHWQCLTYARQQSSQVFGFYDHELVNTGTGIGIGIGWMIRKKKITLLNDHLEMPIDVNTV